MKKLYFVKLSNFEAQAICRVLVSVPDTPDAEQKAEIYARCTAMPYKSAWKLERLEFVADTPDSIIQEV